MVRVYSGHTPEEILAAKTDFIDQIGLKEHLSPTRANGLVSMLEQMKRYALLQAKKIRTQIYKQMAEETTNTQKIIDTEVLGEKIVEVLKTIYDPEIPVDIYELGLVYDVFVK